ncbi:Ig-like domain-containing protein [Pseudomonas sp. UBA4194]|uniref:Ig-like domain-containing protein n=1 Tax=Pseudomonas sp. UBA4194 TaxID=1947317 RepID=UPI0025ED5E60|nr:Ig-like domain-containing protein [Pseudomonas sp. UBA4194]
MTFKIGASSSDGGSIPKKTLAELTTTYLARDNFPGKAFCIDATVNAYIESFPTQWRKQDGTVVSTDPALATSVQLSQKAVMVAAGGTRQLTAQVLPADASQLVSWKSSNPALISVSMSGQIKGEAAVLGDSVTIEVTTANGKKNSTIVSIGASTGVRRLVSSANRYMNRPTRPSDLANGAPLLDVATELVSRVPHRIGSADVNGLCLRVSNDYVWTTGVEGPANNLTIKHTSFEIPGIGSRQVLWDGSEGVVLQTKDRKHSVVVIRPGDFGLERFEVGTLFYVRGHAAVPAGGFYPTVETWGIGSFQCAAFDPTKNACTNIGGTGALTFTNAQTVGVYQPWTPVVTGFFEFGDPLVVLTGSDSIGAGAGDNGPTGRGLGFPERATMGNDWTTAYAACNITRPGGYVFNWANQPTLLDMVKLGNNLLDGILTNNFDDQPNLIDSGLNYLINQVKDSYVAIKASAVSGSGIRPFTIIRLKLMPRTKPPTGPLVTDQELHGPKWGPGGNVEQFHNIIKSYPLVDRFYVHDAFSRYTTDTADPNSNYWKEGKLSASDGTHPGYSVTGPVGADLRLVLDEFAALPVAA